MANTLSASERAQFFARLTRKHTTMLPSVAGAASSRLSFDLPKVRLGQKLFLECSATLNAKHASNTSYTPAAFAPWTLLDRIKITLNNGWNPVDLSGKGLYVWNLLNSDVTRMTRKTVAGREPVVQPVVASSAGTDNAIHFLVEVPFMLNERDVIGLLMLQNQQTLATVNIDIAAATELADATANYTYTLDDIVITPMIVTFSLPAEEKYWPDVSIIKIASELNQAISGAGQQVVSLPCGNMYRKLGLYVTDASGGEADADLSAPFTLVVNSNDVFQEIKPSILAAHNAVQFGGALPAGLFVFDFSDQGQPNYGGSRDYVETDSITRFDLKFTAAGAGNILVVREELARLQ